VAKIKAPSLTGRITQPVLLEAFRNVKRNRGAAGIDKVSIKLYEKNLLESLLALMRRLKDGTFRPLPLRRVHIPKGDGKTRPLGIPAVRDRAIYPIDDDLVSRPGPRLVLGFEAYAKIIHPELFGKP